MPCCRAPTRGRGTHQGRRWLGTPHASRCYGKKNRCAVKGRIWTYTVESSIHSCGERQRALRSRWPFGNRLDRIVIEQKQLQRLTGSCGAVLASFSSLLWLVPIVIFFRASSSESVSLSLAPPENSIPFNSTTPPLRCSSHTGPTRSTSDLKHEVFIKRILHSTEARHSLSHTRSLHRRKPPPPYHIPSPSHQRWPTASSPRPP